ncbi:MAG: radical SAM protein [Humidesulfovibrio sp.]|uniref:radical SAM protein n=1 Tax=Humidesulfovibrio sp. TaxID=2910988 RepID=UPI002733640F|nr:radical SAM protein [Humidesulfovibrio sp.]MDP2849226.1 radical SAM protein [Humidesulfovibrio sp.]
MRKERSLSIDPLELKIEITRACNLRCSFCYLGKGQEWLANRHMPVGDVLRWIDWCVDNDIPGVRFTGGEATMHPDIEMLCNYAHLQKRYVILNTNGMADPRLYDRLLVNDMRVSVPTLDAKRMDDLTGRIGVFQKKVSLLDRMAARKSVRVHMLTPLAPELVGNLEEFVLFLRERPRLKWLPLRLESSPDEPRPITRGQMQSLAEEMDDLMRRYPEQVPGIVLAVPFCSVTPTSLGARVFMGKKVCCGPYVALNVDFDGVMTTCFDRYQINEIGSMEAVRNSPELRPCRTLESLPAECHACEYVEQCAGGCTRPEGLVEHNGGRVDYLAGFVAG